jgi:hypothetical protein
MSFLNYWIYLVQSSLSNGGGMFSIKRSMPLHDILPQVS